MAEKKPGLLLKDDSRKALVVVNGRIRDYNLTLARLKKEYGFTDKMFVLAVDGGVRHCINMHIFPDMIIGDMDSVNIKILEKLNNNVRDIKFINASTAKDQSDTQLALDYLIDQDFNRITIVGALGDRIDHSFANLAMLSAAKYDNRDIKIIDESNEIYVIKKSSEIKGEKGKRISIFSLSPYTYFISTKGLKYRLKNEKLLFSPVRGLSNEFTDDTAGLQIKKGQLLIVREL